MATFTLFVLLIPGAFGAELQCSARTGLQWQDAKAEPPACQREWSTGNVLLQRGQKLKKTDVDVDVGSGHLLRHAARHKRGELGDRSLLILLRSGGPKSPARVASIRSTWAQDLPEDRLVMFSEEHRHFCRDRYGDNHGPGLTCLEATSEADIMNRTDFDWLLVVDDDTYVFRHHVVARLTELDPTEPMTYGVPGCGNCENHRHGFCGGGGYIISRQNLLKMAEATATPITESAQASYLEEFMREPDEEWSDVRFACVAQNHDLSLELLDGMYSWALPNATAEQHIAEMRSADFPLVFHYISDNEHMQRVHREATHLFPSTV